MNNRVFGAPIIVMETDVGAVTAGGLNHGWVSGTPANLADGATVDVLFDLGPLWQQYAEVQMSINSSTATSLSSVQASSSDTTTKNTLRRLRTIDSTPVSTMFATISTVTGPQQVFLRPMGRYLFVTLTNTAAGGAQGATSKVAAAAYPGA